MRGLVLCVVLLAGCTSIDPMYGETPTYTTYITPDDFVAGIDHPDLPYVPGATWTYYVYEDMPLGATTKPTHFVERIEIRVLDETKDINGVEATVVRDTVYGPDGAIIEDTDDWFAQDKEGNVWYLGEATCEYQGGECVDTGGSFAWGVDGALPGIVMHATPMVRGPYYQEYLQGEAMDRARDVAVDKAVTTPLGSFTADLVTEEWNPFDPETVENVYYVAGIGPVIKGELDGDVWDEAEVLDSYDVPT